MEYLRWIQWNIIFTLKVMIAWEIDFWINSRISIHPYIRSKVFYDQRCHVPLWSPDVATKESVLPVFVSDINFLTLLVPATIRDEFSSGNLTVTEGRQVTLVCNATGTPMPHVTWTMRSNKVSLVRNRKACKFKTTNGKDGQQVRVIVSKWYLVTDNFLLLCMSYDYKQNVIKNGSLVYFVSINVNKF